MAISSKSIIEILSQAGISSPRLEASMLQAAAGSEEELQSFIEARLEGKPICKIIGSKGFYKHDFLVNENVLSPRPDTEILVEKALELLSGDNTILELGVGSGCIITSILAELPTLKGVGVDISPKALEVAEKNAKLLGVNDRLTLLNKSWFDESFLCDKFDVIISNPPYIPTEDIHTLDSAVKDYDPVLALDGGIDGLRDYRQIAKISPLLLKDSGHILLEVGINQAQDVSEIFTSQGFKLVDIIKDLNQIDRCIILQK